MKLIIILITSLWFCLGYSQVKDHCTQGVIPDLNYPYQLIQDRCEGFIKKETRSLEIDFVSFSKFELSMQNIPESNFTLYWEPYTDCADHTKISIYPFGEQQYYQMDSTRECSESTYEWPIDIAAIGGIETFGGLGLKASTPLENGVYNLYSPLSLEEPNNSPSDNYYFSFLPASDLKQVFVSIYKISIEGAISSQEVEGWKSSIIDSIDVEAHTAFTIQIPFSDLEDYGLYEFHIFARVDGRPDKATADPILFLHQGHDN